MGSKVVILIVISISFAVNMRYSNFNTILRWRATLKNQSPSGTVTHYLDLQLLINDLIHINKCQEEYFQLCPKRHRLFDVDLF